MSHPNDSTHTHDAAHGHGDEPSIYLRTLTLLLILTAITVGASYIQFGAANVAIALFIASIKAILVALFFMHLKYDKPINSVIAVAGFLFLGIFLMFDLLDFDARNNYLPFNMNAPAVQAEPVPGAAPAGAEGAEKEKGKEAGKAAPKAEEKK
jgi:cytochrome c oxidase subunit 4